MWVQPFPIVDHSNKSAELPHQPESPCYRPFVERAHKVAVNKLIILTSGDFDYREILLNWARHVHKLRYTNMLVLSMDTRLADFLTKRRIPTFDDSPQLAAWKTTRLQRHIQQVVMERIIALGSLSAAGLNVLHTDATCLIVHDVLPTLRALPSEVSIFAQRHKYPQPTVRKLGSAANPGFMYLRAQDQVHRFLSRLAVRGMVEFYLRWTSAVDLLGLNAMLRDGKVTFEGAVSAKTNLEKYNSTTIVKLAFGGGFRFGFLPFDLFPSRGKWISMQHKALVFHGPRTRATLQKPWKPSKGAGHLPTRGPRLRLDQYDEHDFSATEARMRSEGLWLLPDDAEYSSPYPLPY